MVGASVVSGMGSPSVKSGFSLAPATRKVQHGE
jgi:hypothetical protein